MNLTRDEMSEIVNKRMELAAYACRERMNGASRMGAERVLKAIEDTRRALNAAEDAARALLAGGVL